ncbi:Vtc4p [Ascoidea rubescens DSM 1968]|uniref:Vacuolar transporter chaperone complex subunit 4 n=1 Tax=Ascoidea rubescens DSM 1968 TaxID=1344418 RepID=A0A1D2VD06_9ASCO|nr:polyphosphate synthetase protein [Ascoidea rubescens DSM 1968]ODV59516.1 polyphosphate synthetase protein [Ascoidea rubescens DSM 1968]
MKFGEHLRSSLIRDYSFYYISYDDLKHQLKKGLVNNNDSWSNELEEKFLTSLESELDKVYNFTKLKNGEILRRMKDAGTVVNNLVNDLNNATEQDFEDCEEELSDIIADVHDLAKFTRLNYTGFQKIIKKHDKVTSRNLSENDLKFILKPIFQVRLNSKPFFKDNYDILVVKLSELYDLVRTRGNPVKGDSSAGGSQQNFVRQTTKYWVHPDNITELKLIILKHLPVLVFNSNKDFEKEDSAITSVYFDNKNLDLYYGRLRKDEGAEAHRLRWYGSMDSDTIFVERKTHREDWTGEKSVKARFPLKEKHINDFIKGKYTVHQVFDKMRKDKKKSIKEIENLEALATEIQYTILKSNLRPVVRSFYNRTAFQLPGDARVRISLDTELSMIREDNFDGLNRTKGNWRRMDIGVDWPFNQLPEKDIVRFPYAVLEVKLQTQLGQEPPQWVRDLVASHLVEAVPKFSKFIHGVASLLPENVSLIPFWLPQMDVDIRKPKINNASKSVEISSNRIPGSNINTINNVGNSLDEEELMGHNIGQEGAYNSIQSNNFSTNRRNDLSLEHNENTPLLGSSNEIQTNDSKNFARKLTDFLYHYFNDDRVFNVPLGTVFETKFVAPPGKEICVPVRVEPKVYFATERTYLTWLSILMILGGIATSLLTYSSNISAITASIGFFLCAIFVIIYSSYIFVWRVKNIRKKRAVDYYDKFGPTAICAFFGIATLLSYVFKVYN